MSDSELTLLLKFIHLSEGLKNELRNGHTSNGKRESVADHTWRISLMVVLFSSFLDQKISIEKALKIAIVHDLAEVLTGDKPYFLYEGKEDLKLLKAKEEFGAMQKITKDLPEEIGNELLRLWQEYEEGKTYEAKFVKALDKMEAQIQHNEMSFTQWNAHDKKYALTRLNDYCSFDAFLNKFKTIVQEESRKKMFTD
jgi:putative hydrolases of HD superfamily